MGRRTLLTGAAVWLVVVVVVSVATWSVIDAAGRDVTAPTATDRASTPSVGDVVTAPPSTRAAVQAQEPRATVRGASPTPAASPRPTTSAPAATLSPDPQATSGGAAAPPTKAPAPVRARTWNGRPGTVTAQCQGGRVSLVSASPAVGWRMEIDKRGPEEVEVKFRGADGSGSEVEDRDDVEVEARCSGGAPVFSAG